ncbi:MAG: molybdopterin synthase catalytic subunit MoaE [Methylophilus sp.]|jgi:molybdopterin synthase catalytic subunit
MTIRVQTEDFDVGAELLQLRLRNPSIGAVVSFLGLVRDLNDGASVDTMTLEHYPVMTEKALNAITEKAKARWDIIGTLVIHRVGELHACDQIVLVVVTSAHRQQAFQACEYIMDYLKTQAPFWKKEQTNGGERWVEAKATDDEALTRWK